MASRTTLTVILAFWTAFWCLGFFGIASETQGSRSHVACLAAGALLPAAVTAFALALLLLSAHVRALDRADAVSGARFTRRLSTAILAATAAALLAGTVLQLHAGGFLGGADDVAYGS